MTRSTTRTRITDVARLAGVSLSTVSRAMNGNTTVDPALAERVRAAAAELGYTANPLARSLVLGRTQTIAVVVPDLENPTFQSILRGLSRAAAVDGYHILIADSIEQVAEERVLARTTRLRTDGVILCSPRMPEEELQALLPELAPAVIVNRAAQPGTPVVAADYGRAFRELIEHLLAHGHRHLAYLAGVTRSVSHRARQDAITDALRAHPEIRIEEIAAGVDFDSGAAAAASVLESDATGVLAFNDLVAMGLLTELTARGVDVPGGISIVGFDDIPFAAYTSPPLTTAAVPAAELGELAWRAMHDQLEGRTPNPQLTVVPQLVSRGSVAAPPA
jgi:LacI family transcriptional regulator